MRDHDLLSGEAGLRPKAARIEESISPELALAGAAGRHDVLDGAGVLGLQRAVGNGGVSALLEEERSPVHDVISSGGRPLEPDVRTDMESRLGHDFGDVRVHDDAAAHESAQAVNAHAYTVGSNVVFQRDKYDPSSESGGVMLAHELTHVVQQRNGAVDGTSAPGGIKVSDPSDRFEREAASNAEQAMSAPAAAPATTPASAPAMQRDIADEASAPVQRDDAPVEEAPAEEEPVQGIFVQREEDAPVEDEQPA